MIKKKNKEKVVVASGYFDPLHHEHVRYFRLAKKLGEKLVVIVNNDFQTERKKGFCFMPAKERMNIISDLRSVDEVFLSIDKDRSVCKSLSKLKPDVFAKGGDRFSHEIPESKVCKKYGIKIVDGLGKKKQSSSSLLNKAHEALEKLKEAEGVFVEVSKEMAQLKRRKTDL